MAGARSFFKFQPTGSLLCVLEYCAAGVRSFSKIQLPGILLCVLECCVAGARSVFKFQPKGKDSSLFPYAPVNAGAVARVG